MKNVSQVVFLRHTLPKSKIGLPNLDFNEFFNGKRRIHSEKHVNRCLSNLKKIIRVVFETFTPGLSCPTSGFQIFVKTLKYYLYTHMILSIKFYVFNFISFWNVKFWILTIQSRTYMFTDKYSKNTFLGSRYLETHKSGEILASKILIEWNI